MGEEGIDTELIDFAGGFRFHLIISWDPTLTKSDTELNFASKNFAS